MASLTSEISGATHTHVCSHRGKDMVIEMRMVDGQEDSGAGAGRGNARRAEGPEFVKPGGTCVEKEPFERPDLVHSRGALLYICRPGRSGLRQQPMTPFCQASHSGHVPERNSASHTLPFCGVHTSEYRIPSTTHPPRGLEVSFSVNTVKSIESPVLSSS